jgi:hypothetical protein
MPKSLARLAAHDQARDSAFSEGGAEPSASGKLIGDLGWEIFDCTVDKNQVVWRSSRVTLLQLPSHEFDPEGFTHLGESRRAF